MKAPDKIFLQACGSCPLEGDECKVCKFEELEEITWSTEMVFKKDVAYIRKDSLVKWANEKKAELLNEELTDVAAGINMGMDMLIYKIEQL